MDASVREGVPEVQRWYDTSILSGPAIDPERQPSRDSAPAQGTVQYSKGGAELAWDAVVARGGVSESVKEAMAELMYDMVGLESVKAQVRSPSLSIYA